MLSPPPTCCSYTCSSALSSCSRTTASGTNERAKGSNASGMFAGAQLRPPLSRVEGGPISDLLVDSLFGERSSGGYIAGVRAAGKLGEAGEGRCVGAFRARAHH
jgi:hypothetical protein